jgi:hypothetical protein
MAPPIVILIHGMGTFAKGDMTRDFARGVDQAAAYLGLQDFHIAQQVDFVEYNYSALLDEIRKESAEYQGSINQYLQLISGGILGDIAKWLSEVEARIGGDDFLYSHWLDVAYYGLTYHNAQIRTQWAEQLATLLRSSFRSGRKLHVVAHSLGTAVAHDALAKLYRENVEMADDEHLSAATERFESLWMVANVSRLLSILTRFTDPLTSIVHDSNPDMAGCTNYFYNVRNKFDPFLYVKQYDRPIEYGRQIVFDEVREIKDSELKLNPHDLSEYMACPEVTRLFLYRTLGLRFTLDEQERAQKAYHASSIQGITGQTYQDILDFIDTLGDISADDLETVVKAFQVARKAIDELRSHIPT